MYYLEYQKTKGKRALKGEKVVFATLYGNSCLKVNFVNNYYQTLHKKFPLTNEITDNTEFYWKKQTFTKV